MKSISNQQPNNQSMFDVCVANPMLCLTVRMLRSTSIAFSRNFKAVYAIFLPWALINFMQFYHVLTMHTSVEARCLSAFLASCVLTALLRCASQYFCQQRLENFLFQFALMFTDLEHTKDEFTTRRLAVTAQFAKKVNNMLAFMAFFDTIISIVRPQLVKGERHHPFDVQFPMIDMLSSPAYEIMYIFQFTSVYVLTAAYMPYVQIFSTFTLFVRVCLQVLQHRLREIYSEEKSNDVMLKELISCIVYYEKIKSFFHTYNELVTKLVLIEIVINCLVLSFVFYCLMAVTSVFIYCIIIFYALTIFVVLFIFYWYANELAVESLNVGATIYDIPWYNCDRRFCTTVLIFMMQTAKPLQPLNADLQVKMFFIVLIRLFYYRTIEGYLVHAFRRKTQDLKEIYEGFVFKLFYNDLSKFNSPPIYYVMVHLI